MEPPNIRWDNVIQAIDAAQFSIHQPAEQDFEQKYMVEVEHIENNTELTSDEKLEAFQILTTNKDTKNLIQAKGQTYQCKFCGRKGFTVQYCEHCLRDSLKRDFDKWTSGNTFIDEAIREFQLKIPLPFHTIEWIPHEDLVDIQLKAKGGCATIYAATWTKGILESFDPEEKAFIRSQPIAVILKRLDKSNNATTSYLQEVSKENIDSKNSFRHMSNEDFNLQRFLLVVEKAYFALLVGSSSRASSWNYQRHTESSIHDLERNFQHILDNYVHGDLHSGNVLNAGQSHWILSDFGFCGPVEKSPGNLYGNLAYMAPEVLHKGIYTPLADIYAVGMLMYECATGIPPFYGREHDKNLALLVTRGIRPIIPADIPENYQNIMKLCWESDPNLRIDAVKLREHFYFLRKAAFEADSPYNKTVPRRSNNDIRPKASSLYSFKELPAPRKATTREQNEFDRGISDMILGEFDNWDTLADGLDDVNIGNESHFTFNESLEESSNKERIDNEHTFSIKSKDSKRLGKRAYLKRLFSRLGFWKKVPKNEGS
ncbi:hypothetical protein G9A89_017570 [Geosiphon pyriformis]|nr:hypothetical protein G9A89_017570 [Geosiphon pyriformis]